ncbi:MAG: HAMP domain-containing histidine kinase [Candidatus Eremiobacteraeota bacterium]|nr:HAMP domain-containing histidine kinase [Candidatus Eremiobacteraeota bacterium]
MALLCYALLIGAWIIDLLTPQLFVAAILLNGPIALSSLALRRQLTTQLVVAAEIANVIAGYVNGVQAGYHWDAIAIGDRLLTAASFVLVGYMSIKTQEFAREAGASAGRMRQIQIERTLREATGRVRETLNVELVQRAILRESLALLGASAAMLIVRDSAFELPLVLGYTGGDAEISLERQTLSTELASLAQRAREHPGVTHVTNADALGRLMLDALGAREALAAPIRTGDAGFDDVLVELANETSEFAADAIAAMEAFAEQAGIALEQARLFTQLGERNDEIARQKDELGRRAEVIRDIVYALAHDLRTPLVAADVTTKQALAGAYGDLPMRYTEVLRATLSANEEERRIVESLLLVARYEAGEESNLREPVALKSLVGGAVEELKPVAESNGVTLQSEVDSDALRTVGDPHEIRRAVLNLIANAITATPQGGTISIRGGTSKSNVTVSVEDDGYGVPEDLRPALFTRFGSARPGGGTGLGLYIVRRIAEKHNGAITYLPREPRGSIFTLILPAE